MGVLLVPPVASLIYNGLIDASWPSGPYLLYVASRIAIPLLLMFMTRLWVHRTGISALCLLMLTAIFAFYE